MANQEQLDILKQGVKVWNQWRQAYPGIPIDLDYADFRFVDFRHADFRYANLRFTDFRYADLSDANLLHAKLNHADLLHAKLSHVDLSYAILNDVNLMISDLYQLIDISNLFPLVTIIDNDLPSETNLSGANFSNAHLTGAKLGSGNYSGADFSGAHINNTVFSDVDLSTVKGLETVNHNGPSTIGIDTIIRSQGKIPEIFLRNAGVPDSIIEAIPSLIGSLSPIDYYSCFISYSSKDQDFAERLYADLQSKGVRCWFALEDMKIGDKIRPRIEASIHLYDKLLIVLSEHSIASNWVAYEVERALNKEPQGIPNVLFPIRVDDAVMNSKESWANDIKSTRHIGDFTRWKNHDEYQRAFTRLLRDLKAEA